MFYKRAFEDITTSATSSPKRFSLLVKKKKQRLRGVAYFLLFKKILMVLPKVNEVACKAHLARDGGQIVAAKPSAFVEF